MRARCTAISTASCRRARRTTWKRTWRSVASAAPVWTRSGRLSRVRMSCSDSPHPRTVPSRRSDRATASHRSTAPAPTVGRIVGPYALTGPPLTLDSARALVGTDPYAVPELPVRGIYRARMIGYSAVVVVQQPLDSSTAIDVITGRYSPTALDAVVVSGAVRRDSVSPTERALLGRAPADSLAAQRRAQPRPAPAPGALADRHTAALVAAGRGPLPADSLAALQRRLAPLRP